MSNRPVIIIKNKKEETCILTDVAIPEDVAKLADKNVMQKEQERKIKYKSLCRQIQ
jgi:uncharacterized membrane protein